MKNTCLPHSVTRLSWKDRPNSAGLSDGSCIHGTKSNGGHMVGRSRVLHQIHDPSIEVKKIPGPNPQCWVPPYIRNRMTRDIHIMKPWHQKSIRRSDPKCLPAVQSINNQSSDVAQNWKKILTVQDQLIMHSSLQVLLHSYACRYPWYPGAPLY